MRQLLDAWGSRFPTVAFERVLYDGGMVRYAYVGPGLRALGIDPELLTRDDGGHEWLHPDDRARWRAALFASAEMLQPMDEEVRVVTGDGRVRWVRSISNPRRTALGNVVWDGVLFDVTPQREALEAQRAARAETESEYAARLRAMRDTAEALRENADALRLALGTGSTEAALAALDRLEATIGLGLGGPVARGPARSALVAAASLLPRAGLAAVLEGMGWQVTEADSLSGAPAGQAYDLILAERALLGPEPEAEIAALAPARVAVLQATPDHADARRLAAGGAALVVPVSVSAAALRAAMMLAMEAEGTVLLQDEQAAHADDGLTPRQAEVLSLLGRGLTNEAIARELGIAAGTAKLHVAAVLKRLGLRNRTEAALHAREGRMGAARRGDRRTRGAT